MNCAAAVVNWNSGPWLRKCLDSLAPCGIDVVVVDNASADDSIDQAGSIRDRVEFILNKQNQGFAAGVNQAFAATRSKYVLVLNPDVQATPGAVERLFRFMESHPRAGIAGGHVNAKYLPRPLATPWTLIRENIGVPVGPSPGGDGPSGQVAAAAAMIRREAYGAVGGFDEGFYPAWYEDVDFCRQLSGAGWEVHFLPEARFLHDGGYSARVLGPSAFAAAYYRNQLRYAAKHFGAAGSLAVRCSIVAGMLARMAAGPARAGAYSRVIAGALGGW